MQQAPQSLTSQLQVILLSALLLTLYSCSQRDTNYQAFPACQIERREALDDYEKGILHFINSEPSRYDQELEDLLKQKGIQYSFDPFGHYYECYAFVMDSLIKIKLGDEFIGKLKSEADSLFFERRKAGTFDYYEVDTWALRKNSNYSLGGDFMINYLNSTIPPNAYFRFISNIIDRPYYLLEFTINKDGSTSNATIKERNNTEKFKNLEDIIVKEVNQVNDWIPATIRNQVVTAKFQMGVAIDSVQ